MCVYCSIPTYFIPTTKHPPPTKHPPHINPPHTQFLQSLRTLGTPVVLDADALWLATQQPELIQGWRGAVLTPNVAEYKRLCRVVLGIEDAAPEVRVGGWGVGGCFGRCVVVIWHAVSINMGLVQHFVYIKTP